MSENLIVVLSIVAIVAVCLVAFVALITLAIYFTEKKIVAGWRIKAEKGHAKTETDINIETSKQQKN